jgi:hypothetical protein
MVERQTFADPEAAIRYVQEHQGVFEKNGWRKVPRK